MDERDMMETGGKLEEKQGAKERMTSSDLTGQPIIEFDDALKNYIGQFGPYQRWVCLFLSLVGITNAFYIMDIVFIAAPPQDFWCVSNENTTNPPPLLINNISHYSEYNSTPVYTNDKCWVDSKLHPDNSSHYAGSLSISESSAAGPCEQWEFGHADFEDSIIKQWSLVCERSWHVAMSNSAFLAGTLLGVLLGGILSDRFGRRPMLAGFAAAAVVFRIIMIFSPNIHFFTFVRFFVGFTNLDTYTSAFVLGNELVGPAWRVFFSNMMGFFWAIGYMLVAGIAFLMRHQAWWKLTLTLTACCSFVLLYFKFVPESPRWQLSKGKKVRAMKTLRHMAKINGGQLPDDVNIIVVQIAGFTLSFIQLEALPYISRYMPVHWGRFTVAIVYYGLSLNVGDLAGNLYLNTFIMGAVEIPAYLLAQWMLNSKLGRRGSYTVLLELAGVTMLAVYFLHKRSEVAGTVLAMIGKLAVTAAYSTAYIITAELYPTVIRQGAISVAATVGRVGGVFAPFIGHLAKFNPLIPPIIYSLLTITAGALSLFLPETKGRPLPVNIEDLTHQSSSRALCGSYQDSEIDSTDSSSMNDVISDTKMALSSGPEPV